MLVALAVIVGGLYFVATWGIAKIGDQFSSAADYEGPGHGKVTFQVVNGDLMSWIPCFCGCGSDGSGHRNNRDCYVKQVRPDGSVLFDQMAPT